MYEKLIGVLSTKAVKVVRTNLSKGEKLSPVDDLSFTPYESGKNVTLAQINTSKQYQVIEGFGGAFTDSASHVFSQLTPELQDQVIEMYFGESGIGRIIYFVTLYIICYKVLDQVCHMLDHVCPAHINLINIHICIYAYIYMYTYMS